MVCSPARGRTGGEEAKRDSDSLQKGPAFRSWQGRGTALAGDADWTRGGDAGETGVCSLPAASTFCSPPALGTCARTAPPWLGEGVETRVGFTERPAFPPDPSQFFQIRLNFNVKSAQMAVTVFQLMGVEETLALAVKQFHLPNFLSEVCVQDSESF